MADLKTIVNELPKLFHKLNLTIGNSHDLMQQVMIINNVQEQLRDIQKLIVQQVKITKKQHNTVTTQTCIVPKTSFLKSRVCQINTDITTREEFIAEQFIFGTETSFIDLQIKIDSWLEWGDLLQAIAADILSDDQLVKQLNSNINYPSLPAKFQEFEKITRNNSLTIKNSNLQAILNNSNFKEDILQVSQRINNIVNTVHNSQSLLNILLGISSFFGNSGFTLEWLDTYDNLIISSEGKFQDLTEIINNCEFFKEQIDTLILQTNTLNKQSEPTLNNIEDKSDEARVLSDVIQERPQKNFKLGHFTLVIASSLAVLGFGGWISKDKFPYIQQKSQSLNQEQSAVTNFKTALKLGSEASALAETPPHPLIVWQQAETKWQEAINLLASIPKGTSVYTQAQNKLTRYRYNHNAISKKLLNEKKAVTDLQLAEKLANEATFFVQNSPRSSLIWQQALDKWQQAIKLLEAIPESTFVSQQAKEALPSYKTNYAAMSTVIND